MIKKLGAAKKIIKYQLLEDTKEILENTDTVNIKLDIDTIRPAQYQGISRLNIFSNRLKI